MLESEVSATDIYSSETKTTWKKKKGTCGAQHTDKKRKTLWLQKSPIFSGEAPASACCSSALILMGRFLVSCLHHFGTDKNPLKKCYTSSKCIMRLHGHYLNGRSDVLQLAETQTVGGVWEESQRFMWKAGKPRQASVNNSAVWSDALGVLMMLLFLEEVNKKMNSTVQHSLFVSSKWCEWPWANRVASLAIYVIRAPVLMQALITTWTQLYDPSGVATQQIKALIGCWVNLAIRVQSIALLKSLMD